MHRKNAGTLYVSNMSSVSLSLLCFVFHCTHEIQSSLHVHAAFKHIPSASYLLHTRFRLIGASLSELHTSVTALNTCVCIYLCLLRSTTYCKFQMRAFRILQCLRRRVFQLSRENEHEGLLPDCRVGVKESESEDDSSGMHWQHTQQHTF